MINEKMAKLYCSEDVSLIENYHEAIADEKRTWDIHHRKECDENGRTLFTKTKLIEMNLYFNRPAAELIFVTKSMHKKLHREQMGNAGKLGGGNEAAKEKCSIKILQFAKDGTFIKEWQSASEAGRQLGIAQQSICQCCKGRKKSTGGFVWMYAPG